MNISIDRKISAWLFVLSSLVYFSTTGGHLYCYDEEVMFQVTRSIVLKRSFDIPDTPNHRLYGMLGEDGKLYSKFGLGESMAGIPLFIVSRIIANPIFPDGGPYIINLEYGITSLTNIWVCALGVSIFFLFLRRFGFSVYLSFIASLFYGFTTMILPYSKYFFSEPYTLLTLMVASYFAVGINRNLDNHPAWCGLFLGLSVMGRIEILTLIPVFLWYLIPVKSIKQNIWRLVSFLLPLILIGGVMMLYNWIRFRSILQTGVIGSDPYDKFDNPLYVGLYGMLFSPGKSIFLYSPFFLLLFWGIKPAIESYKREAIFMSLLILITFILHSKWHSWMGGWSWGTRRLLVVHPFLAWFSCLGLNRFISCRKKGLVFITLLFIAGMAVQIISVSVNFMDYIRSVPDFDWTNYYPRYAPLFGYIPFLLRIGKPDILLSKILFVLPGWLSIVLTSIYISIILFTSKKIHNLVMLSESK